MDKGILCVTERLSILPGGRVSYRLSHKWRDGTTHVLFEPLELVEKLAALVPPPRFNLARYSGIFAPSSRWRAQVVPFDREEFGSLHHSGCVEKKNRIGTDQIRENPRKSAVNKSALPRRRSKTQN